jgi:sarcosine oxidase
MPARPIAVIGLGATGSAALFQLARRGLHAVGIEQFELGHDRGSSHGPTRIIRPAHFENASYGPLMRRAYTLWRELESLAARKFLHLSGLIEIGPADGTIVRGTLAAAGDLPHELLSAGLAMRRYPVFKLPETFVAVWQPDGGFIEAGIAMAAHLQCAKAAGATIRTTEKVLRVVPSRDGVRIDTDRDVIEADAAIVAAGPWLRSLMPELNLPLRVTRQVVGWFEPATADPVPAFILESEYGVHYGLPAYRRMGIKIAKHHHRDEAVTPENYDMTVSATDEAAIRAPLAKYLPGAIGGLGGAHTCLYTMTPDETFVLDRMPGFPRVVIASPCSGHGFKFSPAIGEIIADLATQGATGHDIARFRLQRFG